MFRFSRFGERYLSNSGLVELMEELGEEWLTNPDLLMLGGGNPAHIPEVQEYFRQVMRRLSDDPKRFSRLIGDYEHPKGNTECIHALVDLLNQEYQWGVREEHILLTSGSQSGFVLLFNLLAGDFADGSRKRILLPGVPEYLGYSNLGNGEMLCSVPCEIRHIGEHEFKYRIDFDALRPSADLNAICVSRPTNPTGNVLTDEEIDRLRGFARQQGIPLIIDNAYGAPIPNILHADVRPVWDEHVIYCMSLSKLGLPGTRTGIIVAHEEIIHVLTRMHAILNLTNNNFGAALVREGLADGTLLRMSREVIRPYYRNLAEAATAAVHKELAGMNYRLHKAEGAMFLWLWLPDLPISSEELYQRLKRRGVLVVSGHHFFPGLAEPWQHQHECLRISYASGKDVMRRAAVILAEELRKL